MRCRLALLLLPLLIALPVAVTACGGEDATETAAGDDAIETIEVSATEFAFDPSEITLDAAGTYRFVLTNDGGAPHALEIEGNGVEAQTDTIDGGDTAELEVTLDDGEYEIYCPVGNHADEGMVGRIVVGAGGGGGATADETETGEDEMDETTTGDDESEEGETTTESSAPGY